KKSLHPSQKAIILLPLNHLLRYQQNICSIGKVLIRPIHFLIHGYSWPLRWELLLSSCGQWLEVSNLKLQRPLQRIGIWSGQKSLENVTDIFVQQSQSAVNQNSLVVVVVAVAVVVALAAQVEVR